MRWRGRRESDNIEDRRNEGGGFGGGRGLGGGIRIGGGRGRMSLGMMALVVIGGLIFGVDPATLLQIVGGSGIPVGVAPRTVSPSQDEPQRDFAAVVLAETEDVWGRIFTQAGQSYTPPVMVLYRHGTRTGCGFGQAAMGPFYCPQDRKIYLDLEFFEQMAQKMGAAGDFAAAYVIAHEVGHHVQTLTGISASVHRQKQQSTPTAANQLQVRMELQADCYAGVWAHHIHALLEPGDIDEALGAAHAVGDDTLQRQSQGRIVPDSFTHGSAAQRQHWFGQGFEHGTVGRCNSFAAKAL